MIGLQDDGDDEDPDVVEGMTPRRTRDDDEEEEDFLSC